MIILAFIHFIFPRHFKWKDELVSLSLINKQLMYVHTFFIALNVLLMGVFCIYATNDILHTRLGQQLSFGLFIFWATRLIFQFFVYSSKLWSGKRFETIIHILFSILWIYFSAVFLMIATG
ncbi:MAG: hypothetical protein JWR72_3600 [Flavisolibacter sp.]|nr:hypothetical protein [Flavisolibacter sp.]